jgi:hypothetical protein
MGAGPVALPAGARMLLASEPLPGTGMLPGDTAVWLAR